MSHGLRLAVCGLVVAVACSLGASAAYGVPSIVKVFDDFDYVWNFELPPGGTPDVNLDRYDNSAFTPGADGFNDWSHDVTTSIIITPDGDLRLNQTSLRQGDGPHAGSGPNEIWDGLTGLGASGYTIEYTVKILETSGEGLTIYETPEDTNATYGITFLLENNNADVGIWRNIDKANDGNPADKIAAVPANDFFTVRVAAEPDPGFQLGLKYSIYVNDALVLGDQAITRGLAADRLIMGKIGGGHGGALDIEEIGFTPGAFHIPEPASLVLLTLGAAVTLRRRW